MPACAVIADELPLVHAARSAGGTAADLASVADTGAESFLGLVPATAGHDSASQETSASAADAPSVRQPSGQGHDSPTERAPWATNSAGTGIDECRGQQHGDALPIGSTGGQGAGPSPQVPPEPRSSCHRGCSVEDGSKYCLDGELLVDGVHDSDDAVAGPLIVSVLVGSLPIRWAGQLSPWSVVEEMFPGPNPDQTSGGRAVSEQALEPP